MHEQLRVYTVALAAEVKARAYWMFITHGLRLRWEGARHLDPVKRHIASGGSLVAISNHESIIDPGVVISLLQKALRGLIGTKIWLASSKFFPHLYDSLDHASTIAFTREIAMHRQEAMEDEARSMGAIAAANRVQMLPIVQSHRMREGKFKRLNVNINLASFDLLSATLREDRTVAGICPEGTRSLDGTLGEAQAGIQHVFRDKEVSDKTMILPLGLVGTRDIHRVDDGWRNPLAPVCAVFGPAFFYYDIRQDADTFHLLPKDLLMLRVARLLPSDKLGYYNQKQFLQYLSKEDNPTG
ncbi:1-acyl-sn-glycerol-3-phosphate acyltransferase [Candidatus Gottesmanbacteria bacterium]|nr:1-acyl-sn-glycerol-3-phosphate acyltransferase [Candidatus Gottesmanbacteria bacterium]